MHRLAATALLSAGLIAFTQTPSFDVTEKSVTELRKAMEDGIITSRQLTAAYLARIAAYDHSGPAINALIALNPNALADADALDRERAARGARGPLHGIPVVIKDNYDTIDLPTTAGSVALKGSMAGRDAFQVRRLRDAGVVVIGKTNLHEFARGITTVSSLGGQTRNPYDPTRNPGGSSGGTGAAVAANFAAFGMGSDTCGSIRYPSAENSLVGLRPTLGLSSRTGILPLAHSQDVGGPMARTIRDVAIALDATAGPDPDDPITLGVEHRTPGRYAAALQRGALRRARLGILLPLFGNAQEDQAVGRVVRAAVRDMEAAGATTRAVEHAEVPTEADGVAIIRYEFKFDLEAYLKRMPTAPVRTLAEILDKRAFHPSLEQAFRRSNDVATLDSEEYRAIVSRNARLREALIRLLDEEQLTAFVYPTLRRTPARIGEPQIGGNCAASAATGLPAITVPAGFADDGMPVGVEFLGRPYSELDLLQLGFDYESATHHRRPSPHTPPLGRRSRAILGGVRGSGRVERCQAGSAKMGFEDSRFDAIRQRNGVPSLRATRARRSASDAAAVTSIPLSINPSMRARMISARFMTFPRPFLMVAVRRSRCEIWRSKRTTETFDHVSECTGGRPGPDFFAAGRNCTALARLLIIQSAVKSIIQIVSW